MKILLTGGSGFLGWNFCKTLRFKHEITAFYFQHELFLEKCQFFKIDIRNRNDVFEAVRKFQPEVVVHTAAITSVQLCDQDRDLAYSVNVEGTKNLLDASAELRAKFIYISTDLVYSGDGSFFTEDTPPEPKSYYAQTKLEGEEIVKTYDNYIILRLALMYGWGNVFTNSFSDWLHTELRAKRKVKVFVDQFRTPIYAIDAVMAIDELISKDIKKEIFNLGGSERISRYDFALKFADAFGYPQDLIIPTPMDSVKTYLAGAKDCSLNISKIQSLLSFKLKNVDEGLNMMKRY
ncbi:SDR family oxidoreductase [Candidatus Kryptobacter tengchongensis]|uniref:dTDP-4-dehydrorhamnose reductase n=1 Tax=Kryptobacter tengchongensis TaxID=1643429 RepID=A0A916LI44_KRYT1|nr:SDR family oxidoreductase [Candidatus Kryptobacter tengchongensis]CUS96943.1 dTDP-4-dehydrorhamnose reductase [Candidatus Kryptobacter tengchongensis]